MKNEQRACANNTGLPDGVAGRLAIFARDNGIDLPGPVLCGEGDERTFSDEFLSYCATTAWSGERA